MGPKLLSPKSSLRVNGVTATVPRGGRLKEMANFYHDQHRRASAQNANGSYAPHSMMTAPPQRQNKSSEIGSHRNKNTVHFARPFIDDSTDHTYKHNHSADEASSPTSISHKAPNVHSKPKDVIGLSPDIQSQSTRAHSPSWSSRSGPVMGRCRVPPPFYITIPL